MSGSTVYLWPRETEEERYLRQKIQEIVDADMKVLRMKIAPLQRQLHDIAKNKIPVPVFVPEGGSREH